MDDPVMYGSPYQGQQPRLEVIQREMSDCKHCRFMLFGNKPCEHPAHRKAAHGFHSRDSILAHLNPHGLCDKHEPSRWTRFLRLFGLRKPAVIEVRLDEL